MNRDETLHILNKIAKSVSIVSVAYLYSVVAYDTAIFTWYDLDNHLHTFQYITPNVAPHKLYPYQTTKFVSKIETNEISHIRPESGVIVLCIYWRIRQATAILGLSIIGNAAYDNHSEHQPHSGKIITIETICTVFGHKVFWLHFTFGIIDGCDNRWVFLKLRGRKPQRTTLCRFHFHLNRVSCRDL